MPRLSSGPAVLPDLQRVYECQRKLNAIKVDALHSYIRYLPDQYHEFYPPADPEELRICRDAQKQKRQARRAVINHNGDRDDEQPEHNAAQNGLDSVLNDLLLDLDQDE